MMKNTVQTLKRIAVCVVVATIGVTATASPQVLAPEKAIRARQAAYFLMGMQMARINATVKGDVPFDKSTMQISVEALDLIGRMVTDNFPPGSDQGTTKAKPEVWKEAPRFKQLALESQSEAAKLKAAVHAGDMSTIKAAYGATSKSCKACHDTFKAQ
ncbi:MAG: cytochrome c [Rhizobacter sp.]|nr:cytochrome c [Rhizobacter sp.]